MPVFVAKNVLLIMITLCPAGYGLTDVLFFSREYYCLSPVYCSGPGDRRQEDTAEQPLLIDR